MAEKTEPVYENLPPQNVINSPNDSTLRTMLSPETNGPLADENPDTAEILSTQPTLSSTQRSSTQPPFSPQRSSRLSSSTAPPTTLPDDTSRNLPEDTSRNLPKKFNLPSGVNFPVYKCFPTEETVPHSQPRSPVRAQESNREELLRALKNLQEKIFQLEKEKNKAMTNLRNVNTAPPRQKIQENRRDKATEKETINEITELTTKLFSAESRCVSLDKYLNELKETFEDYFGISFEEVMTPEASPFSRQQRLSGLGNQSLGNEKARLNNMRENTEKSIRELENRLQQARRYKQMIDEKSVQLDRTPPPPPIRPPRPILQSTPFSVQDRLH